MALERKLPPLPLQNRLTYYDIVSGRLGQLHGKLTREWQVWITNLVTKVDSQAYQAKAVSLTAQSASIGATAVSIASLTAGVYRMSYRARVTQAATTSSSLLVTISWVDGTITCSLASAAVTGNTTATVISGSEVIRVDQDGPINYATTYASTGATPMQYSLDVSVEALP